MWTNGGLMNFNKILNSEEGFDFREQENLNFYINLNFYKTNNLLQERSDGFKSIFIAEVLLGEKKCPSAQIQLPENPL